MSGETNATRSLQFNKNTRECQNLQSIIGKENYMQYKKKLQINILSLMRKYLSNYIEHSNGNEEV